MKLEIFKEVIEKMKEADEILDKTYAAGIDLTNLFDPIKSVIDRLIGSIYGKDGFETFYWWCHEKEYGTRKDLTMTDVDNNLLCETIEDLHQYLEENIVDDYMLPRKLTDEERLEIIKGMFNKTKK